MLAMEVNDDAGSLAPRGALRFFVGTPPGACSLLQGAVLLRDSPIYNSQSALAMCNPCNPWYAARSGWLQPSSNASSNR